MPTTGRESRRSSRSGTSSSDAPKSERREKAKSSQSYSQAYSASRRASLKPELSSIPSERPQYKSRTHSLPLVPIPARSEAGGDYGERNIGGSGGKVDAQMQEDTEEHVSTPRASEIGIVLDGGQDDDEVAGAVGVARHYQPFQNAETTVSEPIPEINIAVLGAAGVGKSTFMQRALDLPCPIASAAVERKVPIDGSIYLVRLLELPIDDVDIDDDDTVSWPDTIENNIMPRVDGALTLYDVKDKGSLENIPQMLNAISKASLPSVLVSCKCDTPPAQREIDPSVVEKKAKSFVSNLKVMQTSGNSPESTKKGLSMILKAIMAGNAQRARDRSTSRRRAQSNAVRPVSPRPPNVRQHSRASSEASGKLLKDGRHARHDSSLTGYGGQDRLKVPKEAAEDEMHRSFLNLDGESSTESARSSLEAEAEDETPASAGASTPVAGIENGVTFDELVDRLLAQPTSKADTKFAAIFLALYRKFAAPSRLLEAIVQRFDVLDKGGNSQLMKIPSQLRYLAILEQWISNYPGDFAFPNTRKRMGTFIAKLAEVRIFTVAAKEMTGDLDIVTEDDDTDWAYNDKARSENADAVERWTMSSSASTLIDDPSVRLSDAMGGVTVQDNASVAATVATDATERSTSGSSTTSSQIMLNVEAAQRQAQLLQPIPRYTVSKLEWHKLMDYSDDTIARELTRIDWIMFSSIRPRDLVRQVSLSASEKAACKNLVNVQRMIDHFNQLACWVANFVLFRDKPKHRALMLEKFMRIARKVRELNNYNALGAIIAGIKSSSVHRLTATRELVPPAMTKDWMKLEILMSPSRSHAAYRLAWENSSSERIPYIPLHRRDLVFAEEGNKTFAGDEKDGRINWQKFEVMGEVIIGMQKAQGLPYKNLGGARGNEDIKSLVLDGKLMRDEDELYERSTQVEPTASSAGTGRGIREFFRR